MTSASDALELGSGFFFGRQAQAIVHGRISRVRKALIYFALTVHFRLDVSYVAPFYSYPLSRCLLLTLELQTSNQLTSLYSLNKEGTIKQ